MEFLIKAWHSSIQQGPLLHRPSPGRGIYRLKEAQGQDEEEFPLLKCFLLRLPRGEAVY